MHPAMKYLGKVDLPYAVVVPPSYQGLRKGRRSVLASWEEASLHTPGSAHSSAQPDVAAAGVASEAASEAASAQTTEHPFGRLLLY